MEKIRSVRDSQIELDDYGSPSIKHNRIKTKFSKYALSLISNALVNQPLKLE